MVDQAHQFYTGLVHAVDASVSAMIETNHKASADSIDGLRKYGKIFHHMRLMNLMKNNFYI